MKKIIFFFSCLIILSSCAYHHEVLSILGRDPRELVLRDQNNMLIESSKWKSSHSSKYEYQSKFEKGISKSMGFKAVNNILYHNPYCQKLIVSNQTLPEFYSPTVQLDPKSDLEKHKDGHKTPFEKANKTISTLIIILALLIGLFIFMLLLIIFAIAYALGHSGE